jgi:ferrochelatase
MARGILLLNMGGPNSIDEVELFLRNMFADPRILPLRPFMRRMIANRIVRKRLHEAEENYRQIGGKSPLTDTSRSLASKVEGLSGLPTRLAMRYVPPFASDALEEFRAMGVDKIVAFPMYPQYSTTTTASSLDDVQAHLSAMGYDPDLTLIDPYYDDPAYIDIVLDRIKDACHGIQTAQYDLILSAHGLPMSIVRAGDPYQEQVEANVRAIEVALQARGILFRSVRLVYQSRVGSGAWLEPNLIDVLRRPEHLKVLIYPLSFTVDNSETVYELDIEHREVADKIGYDDYRVATCPNDADDFVRFVAERIDA